MKTLERWKNALERKGKIPVYKLIAQLIEDDINEGRLSAREQLPTLRDLAQALQLNYSTASRGYTEARKRGLIDSTTGAGCYVKGGVPSFKPSLAPYEMMMNLAVEPNIPTLVEKIKDSAITSLINGDIFSLLRYRDIGGSAALKEAYGMLMRRTVEKVSIERTLATPGIHSTIVALLTHLCSANQIVCVDSLTYPGIKSAAAQLGKTLYAIERDVYGPIPRLFEHICKTHHVAALYLNPTMHNPTSTTMPLSRREALSDIALRYNVAIIEDDAYALLADKNPCFANIVPELTYYIGGLSKCFGAGVRAGYLLCPTARQTDYINGALRSLNIMDNSITQHFLFHWITDGSFDEMVAAVKREANLRSVIVQKCLADFRFSIEKNAFHFWLNLPQESQWHPSDLTVLLRNKGINAVSSAAFATNNNPPSAIRICTGGPTSQTDLTFLLTELPNLINHTEPVI